MSKIFNRMTGLISALTIVTVLLLTSPMAFADEQKNTLEEGKNLAFSRSKGNCLACHMIPDGESPGNIGPPLISMKTRYPDKAKLKEQISDAAIKNSETAMPLFGRYEILTESELDKVVDYIYSL